MSSHKTLTENTNTVAPQTVVATANSETIATWTWDNGKRIDVTALANLFDVVVLDTATFRLVPKCGLAKSLLGSWMGGELKRSVVSLGGNQREDWRYGRTVDYMEFEHRSDAMLCSGDDPHFTGMSLNPDEQKACRALVDRMRHKTFLAARRSRKTVSRKPLSRKKGR